MKVALGVEYDGSSFSGWQSQLGMETVQDMLQRAISSIADETISVVAAGRTDAGVHALEQVIHFETRSNRPLTAWVRGANALLPEGISVLWATEVDQTFHARFSACARSYRYDLYCRAERTALYARRVGWFHLELDVEKMSEAASYLLGEHDFSAFRAAECQAKSPVKTMTHMEIRREENLIRIYLTANAFLHHMVRNIVGSLIYVGKGKHDPEWMRQILYGRDRSLAAPTFSPYGLYLQRVSYAESWGLPQIMHADRKF